MATVTLVSPLWADEGVEFVYRGPVEDCEGCPVFDVCQNLDVGRRYEIVGVRDKVHESFVFAEGAQVVEVEEQPIRFNIPEKKSRGTSVTYEPVDCDYTWCPNWDDCFDPALDEGARYDIEAKHGTVECPKGYDLIQVEGEES